MKASVRQTIKPELVGREVSVRSVLPLWEAARRRGHDPALLAVGTECTIGTLTDPRERVSYAVFHRVMSDLGAMLGDDELVEVGREVLESPFLRALLLPRRYLFGAADIYSWVFGPRSPIHHRPRACDGPGDRRPGRRSHPRRHRGRPWHAHRDLLPVRSSDA